MLDSGKARRRYRSGVNRFKRGDNRAARRLFQRAIQADRRYAPAYRGLGLVYRRQHRSAAAVRAFRKYLRLAPRAKDRKLINRLIRQLS